ncbi:hypothetical protein OG989_28150 [Micromonospora sp. NBC_01740]|uniref:hypothetical protein n=1 Tax=Micromonospora sp. NBC_01740 TaxID=2975986 RepID=UPI002E0FD657|nr:hypothetical protein OG989_28150 [Micromonospora sp. NBC_01740]
MIGTLTRHIAGAVAAWLVYVAEGSFGLLARLALALVADAGPGRPLARPFMVLDAALPGAVLVLLVVVPAVVIGDVALARRGAFARTLAACGVAVFLVGLYVAGIAAVTGAVVADAALAWFLTTTVVLCPVVVHAAVVQGARAATGWLARWCRPGSPATVAPSASSVDHPGGSEAP